MTEKQEHILVPKHQKLSEKEKKELFDKYKITLKEIPKILITDPTITELQVQEGDIIKITRHSPTRGQSYYYRGVINA